MSYPTCLSNDDNSRKHAERSRRAIAHGKGAGATPVEEIATEEVLYCYQDDDMEAVAGNMRRATGMANAQDLQRKLAGSAA